MIILIMNRENVNCLDYLLIPVGNVDDVPGFAAVLGSDDAPFFHLLNQPGGPVVADFQASLEI